MCVLGLVESGGGVGNNTERLERVLGSMGISWNFILRILRSFWNSDVSGFVCLIRFCWLKGVNGLVGYVWEVIVFFRVRECKDLF